MRGRKINPHTVAPDRWYGLAAWERRAAAQLQSEPLCRFCHERGTVTAATVADHVEPHRGDWNEFALGKLQSLCKACHDSGKQREELYGFRADVDTAGHPLDPRHPAYRR